MGLSIRTPGCQGTVWGHFEHQAISAPITMGLPWSAKTVLVNLCHNRYQGALFLSDGVLLSCTGLSIRTPGCQGTEWVSLNSTHQLTTPIPGPMQANMDSNEYPCQNISKLVSRCTSLVRRGAIVLHRSFHTDSRYRLSRH
jgi:hypothetical protein